LPIFSPTKSVQRKYETQLRKVARIVGGIVETFTVGDEITNQSALDDALLSYSIALEPWAKNLTSQIIQEINGANKRDWDKYTKDFSASLRRTLKSTPIGHVALQQQLEQVELIKSLPIEAGLRAQKIAQNAATGGMRADEAAQEILKTSSVTQSRAVLIARTEIAKTNAAFIQARSQSIGSSFYIWRTVGDAQVRSSHEHLNGTRQSFSNPPFIPGEGNHGPGEIWNCRCTAEPIITV